MTNERFLTFGSVLMMSEVAFVRRCSIVPSSFAYKSLDSHRLILETDYSSPGSVVRSLVEATRTALPPPYGHLLVVWLCRRQCRSHNGALHRRGWLPDSATSWLPRQREEPSLCSSSPAYRQPTRAPLIGRTSSPTRPF